MARTALRHRPRPRAEENAAAEAAEKLACQPAPTPVFFVWGLSFFGPRPADTEAEKSILQLRQ